jgi:hypothetical protein
MQLTTRFQAISEFIPMLRQRSLVLGIPDQALAKTELSELYRPYSAGSGKTGVRGLNGLQGIPELMEVRGPISSLRLRQLGGNDKGERLLHGSSNGSHSILQWQRILKMKK